MPSGVSLRPLDRRDPAVAATVRVWRRLTTPVSERRAGEGGRTLVACSGGVDSSALVLALASASRELVVGHVLHDLRPREQAVADRDAVRGLADALGLEFVAAEAPVKRAGGNAEGAARRARYACLAELAAASRCGWVATGHQLDDQFESVFMALLRGAGPSGLRGVAARRRLALVGESGTGESLYLVRPMLRWRGVGGVTRADCERVCAAAGWAWREDVTNTDRRFFRNALRHGPLAELKRLRPGCERRVAASAELLRECAAELEKRAARLLASGLSAGPGLRVRWDRASLRAEGRGVVGGAVRAAAVRLGGRADQLGVRATAPVVSAVFDRCTDPRRFALSSVGIEVTAHEVVMAERANGG